MTLEDAYAELEVDVGASEAEVRQARNILLRVWHPDRHQADPTLRSAAERKTSAVNVAFEMIERARFPNRESFEKAEPEPQPKPPNAEVEQLLKIRELEIREREVAIKERLAARPTTTEWIDEKLHSASKGFLAVASVGAFAALLVVGVLVVVVAIANTPGPRGNQLPTGIVVLGIGMIAWPVVRKLSRPRTDRAASPTPRAWSGSPQYATALFFLVFLIFAVIVLGAAAAHLDYSDPLNQQILLWCAIAMAFAYLLVRLFRNSKSAPDTGIDTHGHGVGRRSDASNLRSAIVDDANTTPRDALRIAQELHFSKQFESAVESYAAIVERWPNTDEARAAGQQLENLKGSNRKRPTPER